MSNRRHTWIACEQCKATYCVDCGADEGATDRLCGDCNKPDAMRDELTDTDFEKYEIEDTQEELRQDYSPRCAACLEGVCSECIGQGCYCDCQVPA